MKPWPRSLFGPVMCMARPRRPEAEVRLVRKAACVVRSEMHLNSAKAIGREVARRVVKELAKELEGDPLDLALAAIGRDLLGCPFQRLATCPDINTIAEFVERRIRRIEDRQGRYLSTCRQAEERATILAEVEDLLTGRYDRHLRT